MDYQFIHNISGRFRLLIPRLATDPDYAHRLQGLIESINFVTEVRINSWAQSLVVSYKTRLSTEVVQKQLIDAIEKADSSVSPPSKVVTPKSSLSASESATNQDEFGKPSKAAVEEKEVPSISQQNPLVEDPWDSEQLSVTSDQLFQ